MCKCGEQRGDVFCCGRGGRSQQNFELTEKASSKEKGDCGHGGQAHEALVGEKRSECGSLKKLPFPQAELFGIVATKPPC